MTPISDEENLRRLRAAAARGAAERAPKGSSSVPFVKLLFVAVVGALLFFGLKSWLRGGGKSLVEDQISTSVLGTPRDPHAKSPNAEAKALATKIFANTGTIISECDETISDRARQFLGAGSITCGTASGSERPFTMMVDLAGVGMSDVQAWTRNGDAITRIISPRQGQQVGVIRLDHGRKNVAVVSFP